MIEEADEILEKIEEILEKINEVKKEVDKLPSSREKSLVLTKLDEAKLWASEL